MKSQFKPLSLPHTPRKKYRDHPIGAREFFFLWTSCDFSSQAELCAFSKELGEQIQTSSALFETSYNLTVSMTPTLHSIASLHKKKV